MQKPSITKLKRKVNETEEKTSQGSASPSILESLILTAKKPLSKEAEKNRTRDLKGKTKVGENQSVDSDDS